MDSVSSLLDNICSNNESYDLSNENIIQLEEQGNKCNNWKNIKLTTNEQKKTISNIINCNFDLKNDDMIYIGSFIDRVKIYDDIEVSSGLKNCTFSGTCIISNNCYIIDTMHIRNTVIGECCVIMGCGIINCYGVSSYSNNMEISIGPENGGREVFVYTGLKYSAICKSIVNRCSDENLPIRSFQSNKNIIGSHSVIINCDMIRNSLIGAYSSIKSSSIDTCTLNSNEDRPIRVFDKATLKCCILNHDCSASGSCHAENVYMFESSSIGEYARVVQSIVGPDSSIAGGECHHSLLGPFVGFHHHSLLIASTWAMGRGNIGYGAKIGANHTGRVNDQECILGEGCFMGLDSAIKFPFNILGSPYSIIAANTKCQSQKLSFPFSLLYSEENEVNSNKTFIKPGWILSANPYLLERSEMKYGKRSKAKYHNTNFPILRPSIMEMVMKSLKFLEQIVDNDKYKNELILTSDLDGCDMLGKCCLLMIDLKMAVKSYSNLLKRYALEVIFIHFIVILSLIRITLKGLFTVLQDDDMKSYFEDDNDISSLSSMPIEDLLQSDLTLYDNLDHNETLAFTKKITNHRIYILKSLYPLINWNEINENRDSDLTKNTISPLLQELLILENEYLNCIIKSKTRDTVRGSTIIPDYIQVNKSAKDGDDVIKVIKPKINNYIEKINAYLV
jgi:hypothetical protein